MWRDKRVTFGMAPRRKEMIWYKSRMREGTVASSTYEQDVKAGKRFTFGKNWADFLSTLNEDRIREAEKSLRDMLETESLSGKRFLDIGSGSGLFSLAARRLGARVHSFDFDPNSVACAETLRARFFQNDPNWTIERGSALDLPYLKSLGFFDVVYSWGVLHHTGDMWGALENAGAIVSPGGKLFVAIYNDQGLLSRYWKIVKKIYCSGLIGRAFISAIFVPYYFLRSVAKSLILRENVFATYRKYRGMSIYHDWIDWLGGYPFEVARPEELMDFYRKRGFQLLKLKSTNTLGNNELVLLRM